MQGYNLEIRHIPGKRNPADTLIKTGQKRRTGKEDSGSQCQRRLSQRAARPLRCRRRCHPGSINEIVQCSSSESDRAQCQCKARPSGPKRSVPTFIVSALKAQISRHQALKASVSDSNRDQSSSDSARVRVQALQEPVQFKTSISVSSSRSEQQSMYH